MELSQDNFKSLMRLWPTGVAVIATAGEDGKKYGFTANSFTSVSLDPLLVSFCLKNTSSTLEHFRKSKKFTVSILTASQVNLAKHFASVSADKFAKVAYLTGAKTVCPYIKDASGWLECELRHEYAGGDHMIFVGEVVGMSYDNGKTSLSYYAGGFV